MARRGAASHFGSMVLGVAPSRGTQDNRSLEAEELALLARRAGSGTLAGCRRSRSGGWSMSQCSCGIGLMPFFSMKPVVPAVAEGFEHEVLMRGDCTPIVDGFQCHIPASGGLWETRDFCKSCREEPATQLGEDLAALHEAIEHVYLATGTGMQYLQQYGMVLPTASCTACPSIAMSTPRPEVVPERILWDFQHGVSAAVDQGVLMPLADTLSVFRRASPYAGTDVTSHSLQDRLGGGCCEKATMKCLGGHELRQRIGSIRLYGPRRQEVVVRRENLVEKWDNRRINGESVIRLKTVEMRAVPAWARMVVEAARTKKIYKPCLACRRELKQFMIGWPLGTGD